MDTKILSSMQYKPYPVQGGYSDRILEIDLGVPEISVMEVPSEFKKNYIGGRGYALKLIWDRVQAGTPARWRVDECEAGSRASDPVRLPTRAGGLRELCQMRTRRLPEQRQVGDHPFDQPAVGRSHACRALLVLRMPCSHCTQRCI